MRNLLSLRLLQCFDELVYFEDGVEAEIFNVLLELLVIIVRKGRRRLRIRYHVKYSFIYFI